MKKILYIAMISISITANAEITRSNLASQNMMFQQHISDIHEVEWIEAFGGAYIDTECHVNVNNTIRSKFKLSPEGDWSYIYLAGTTAAKEALMQVCRWSSYTHLLGVWHGAANSGGGMTVNIGGDNRNDIFECISSSSSYKIINYNLATEYSGSPQSAITNIMPTSLLVFGGSGSRLYHLTIDNQLNLIPVRFRNESGNIEGGGVDLMSGKIFRNNGSGKFIIGPDVDNSIIPIEYLESTGVQYIIISNLTFNAYEFGVRIVANVTSSQGSGTKTLAGFWGPGSWGNSSPNFGINGNYKSNWFGTGKNWRAGDANMQGKRANTDEIVDMSIINLGDWNGSSMTMRISSPLVNEDVQYTNPYASVIYHDFCIFGILNNNNVPGEFIKMKLYRLTLYNLSEPFVDLIPVRIRDKGYLYDNISGQLHGNAGSAVFILGPDKTN